MTDSNVATELLDPTNPDDATALSTEYAQRAEGTDPFTPAVQAVYFGFDEILQAMFPDGVTYLEHRVLTEGKRTAYNKSLKRVVRVQNVTKDALMNTPTGEERAALMEVAVFDWNLIGPDRKPIPFNLNNLRKFVENANPAIIDHLYKQIAEANPWLNSEVTVEDIDAEIANLQEMREKKVEEEAAKNGSSR